MKDKRKKEEQNLCILPDEIRPISEEMTMEEKNKLTSRVLQHMKQINEQTQEENVATQTHTSNHIIWKWSKRVAIALLAISIATGGVTYAVSSGWNTHIAEFFHLSDTEETKTVLDRDGFVDNATSTGENKTTCKNKNITLELVQTVSDENICYIFIKARFGKAYKDISLYDSKEEKGTTLVYSRTHNNGQIFCEGTDVTGSNVPIQTDEENTAMYMYTIEGNYQGKTLELSMDTITVTGEGAKIEQEITGNWNLTFSPSVGLEHYEYSIGKEITVGEYTVTVDRLVVTPLSYKLYLTSEHEWRELNKLSAEVAWDTEKDSLSYDEQGNLEFLRTYQESAIAFKETKKRENYEVPVFGDCTLFYNCDGLSRSKVPYAPALTERAGGQANDENSLWIFGEFEQPTLQYNQLDYIRFGGQLIELED